MAKKYGLPYQGSKSRLAENIIAAIPAAKNFYDLFAGGCAITQCALESGRYKKVFCNDIQDAPRLFVDAVNGNYKNEKRWISREQFHAEKMHDPYVRWVWSFGNNGADYLFSPENEKIKKIAHEYLFKNGYDGTKEKRLELIKKFKADKKIQGRFELEQLEQLERLEQLEQLERLEQLQQLERFNNLTVTQKDYRKIKIKKDSVVYCDIPYPHKIGQKEKYYGIDFDHAAFYEWVRNAKFPVYFSSVFAPDDFETVWEKPHPCRIMKNKGSHGKKEIIERLFWNGVSNA